MGGYESDSTQSSSRNRPVLDALHQLLAGRRKSAPKHTTQDAASVSDLSTNDDMIHSTRQQVREDDSVLIPSRSPLTNYQRHELSQIDEDNMSDESLDVEIGRGGSRVAKNTPARPNRSFGTSEMLMDLAPNSSLYATPQGGSKQQRKTTTTTNLRKEIHQRNVSLRRFDDHDKENTPVGSRKQPEEYSTPRGVANSTRDSFAIPEFTNMTDIMAPLNATPAVTKSARTQRRVSQRRPLQNFHPVSGIPLPDDEKHLIRQLEMLSDKIAKLEVEQSEQHQQILEYEEEILSLRTELESSKRARRSDSALGSSDEEGSSRTKLQIENTRLHATVNRLQNQIEEKDRRIKVLNATINRLKNDQAGNSTQQIAAFEQENDYLRQKVDDLQREIEDLYAQLDNTRDGHDEQTRNWTLREQDLTQRAQEAEHVLAENHDLKQQLANARADYDKEVRRIRKEANAIRAAEEAAKAQHAKLKLENEKLQNDLINARTNREKDLRAFKNAKPGDIVAQQEINRNLEQYNEDLKAEIERLKLEATLETRLHTNIRKQATSKTRTVSKSGAARAETARTNRQAQVDEESDNESTTDLSDALLAHSASRNITVPSAVGRKSIDADTELSNIPIETERDVRGRIELERLNKSHRRVVSAVDVSLSRKSSLKNIKGASKVDMGDIRDEHSVRSLRSHNNTADNEFMAGANQATHSRRASLKSRHKSTTVQDMTSGFILPDFTLSSAQVLHPKTTSTQPTTISIPHDPKKCTVCYRLANPSAQSIDIEIPVPIPASIQQADDIDTTSRPSESPKDALNRVIKQVCDEIAHLKIQLHNIERRINAHDGSRGSRERQALHDQLDSLNRALATKNAQLYSLYDVLEGMKTAGNPSGPLHAIEEDEDDVELTTNATDEVKEIIAEMKATRRVTIQSPPSNQKHAAVNEWESEEDEDEAPWEGCFTETTGSMGLRRG
jgi:centrosomal CEP57-like protein